MGIPIKHHGQMIRPTVVAVPPALPKRFDVKVKSRHRPRLSKRQIENIRQWSPQDHAHYADTFK